MRLTYSPKTRWQTAANLRIIRRRLARIRRRFTIDGKPTLVVGLKYRNGRFRQQIAITALVEQKSSIRPEGKRLPRYIRVGSSVDGRPLRVKTDVLKLSKIAVGNSLASGDTIEMLGRRGTCAFAWHDAKGTFILTCSHVVTGGGPTPPLGTIFAAIVNGTPTQAQLVSITPWGPGANFGDAAILCISNNVQVIDFALNHSGAKIGSFWHMDLNKIYAYSINNVAYYCRTTHEVDDGVSLPVDFGHGPVQFSKFFILQMMDPANRPTRAGHSGAVIGQALPNGIVATGLVFARNSYDPLQTYGSGANVTVGDTAPFAYAFNLDAILTMVGLGNF